MSAARRGLWTIRFDAVADYAALPASALAAGVRKSLGFMSKEPQVSAHTPRIGLRYSYYPQADRVCETNYLLQGVHRQGFTIYALLR
jgi:hypothetical protein